MNREKISLSTTATGLMYHMGEGNPGAFYVLKELVKIDPEGFFITLLALDDMNIRGSQIWVGYKDFAGQDIEKFVSAVEARSMDMVETINRECPDQKAVQCGASFAYQMMKGYVWNSRNS